MIGGARRANTTILRVRLLVRLEETALGCALSALRIPLPGNKAYTMGNPIGARTGSQGLGRIAAAQLESGETTKSTHLLGRILERASDLLGKPAHRPV